MKNLVIKEKIGNTEVDVAFCTGVYNIDFGYSGTGKSYLFSKIDFFALENGLDICRCNYMDTEDTVMAKITSHIYDIIILDNADLYYSPKVEKKLAELGNCIIIMSMKQSWKVGLKYAPYLIRFTKKGIIGKVVD